MCNTVRATGEQMLLEGHIASRFYDGCKQVDLRLVIFKNIKTLLLSVNVMHKLNIFGIHSVKSSVNPLERALFKIEQVFPIYRFSFPLIVILYLYMNCHE